MRARHVIAGRPLFHDCDTRLSRTAKDHLLFCRSLVLRVLLLVFMLLVSDSSAFRALGHCFYRCIVLSSLWSYYPLCGRTILSVVVLNSVVLSSLWSYYPLCDHTILSAVVLSSLRSCYPLYGRTILSMDILSSQRSYYPLCGRIILSAVVLSSLW